MRKQYLLSLMVFFLVLEMRAQNLEITPFTGYTFDHSFPIVGGRATLGGGQAWGGMLGFSLNKFTELEVLYSWQGGTSSARSTAIQSNVRTQTNANYILVGGNRLFPINSQMALFSGAKVGAGILAFPNGDFNDISRFTVGLNGGMKYFVSENIGIRLQGNLMMPISNVGANLWWSPGGGTQVGLSGWSSVIQFGFTGGLIFRLSQN